MLVESLVKETVELQGFRVLTVRKANDGLEAELAPDGRYAPRCSGCSGCGRRVRYRDYPSCTAFSSCAAVGDQRASGLRPTPGNL